ncbi:RNA polymerase sigma factor, partial [Amnimonas aquatica]
MPANLDLLFRNHHGELKRMAYGRLGDREAAADVVQDAFLRYAVMAQSERQAAIESPRQFLWRIVQNLIIDMARRRRRRGEHVCIDDVA